MLAGFVERLWPDDSVLIDRMNVSEEAIEDCKYEDAIAAGRIMEQRQLPLERLVSHQLPLERVGDAIQALNSDFTLDGRTVLKIAIAPNGPVD